VCGTWRPIQQLPINYSVTRRQKCTFNLTWEEPPPSENMVGGPVQNAGSNVMLHVPDNKYSNSLVADEFALSCSRKATFQYAWKWMTWNLGGGGGVRTRMLWQVVSHLALRLPHHKRVCFIIRCCSKDQRRNYTCPA